MFNRDTGKKKKLSEDDDFEPLKPVNITPSRLQKKKPESIDKMLTTKDLTYLEKEGNCLQDIHIAMAGALLKSNIQRRQDYNLQFTARSGYSHNLKSRCCTAAVSSTT